MLTIYNRQKQEVGGLKPFGMYADVAEVAVNRRLNSEYSLSFLMAMISPNYALIEKEGIIECEGQKYVIKKIARDRKGMGRTVKVTCPHIMRRMIDTRVPYALAQEEALGKSIDYFTNILTTATGGVFTFQIMDAFPLKDVYQWGYKDCLTAFQDIINAYGAEFIPDNYNIKIYLKINIDNGAQYRYSKNIIDDTFETNTDTLCTRMTGLAKDSLSIIDLPSSYLTEGELALLTAIPEAIVGGIIKVPYLISQYLALWSTPDNTYFDADFESTDIDASDEAGKVLLLNEIRKKLAASEVPDLQIQVNPVDLWKKDPTESRPQLGETVYAVDQGMELNNITVRIMEITEYPFDPSKNSQVTLANYILKDTKDTLADLNASKNLLDSLMTNGKINTSVFETFAKQAVLDINSSKTEVIYEQRGIVLQEKTNVLEQVILASRGIYLTVDGGLTSEVAITAAGIVADAIKVGTLLANLVTVRTNLTGSAYFQIDGSGMKANDGTINTIEIGVDGRAYFRGDITSDATITGALIQTKAAGNYPRTEINSTGDFLGAYFASDRSIILNAYDNTSGAPYLRFNDASDQVTIDLIFSNFTILANVFVVLQGTDVDINASSGDIRIYPSYSIGKQIRIPFFDTLRSDFDGITLQDALDAKQDTISGYSGSFVAGASTVNVVDGIITSVV
jgi:phage minor structural protein